MKHKKMKIAIMIVLAFGIIYIIVSRYMNYQKAHDLTRNGSSSSSNTNEYNVEKYRITQDQLNDILAKKHKDKEMQLSEQGYSDDELQENILATSVFCATRSYAKDDSYGFYNGNIYDIDDNYVYIITCSHGIDEDDSICYDMENYGMKICGVSFPNFDTVDVPFENVRICTKTDANYDIGMIAIDKSTLKEETLNMIKSINIDNFGKLKVEDKTFTAIARNHSGEFNVYTATDMTLSKYISLYAGCESKAINGVSGSGFFDEYGNYFGLLRNNKMIYYSIFPEYYDMLLDFNPNY